MIFLTVGTQFPFDRLVKAVDDAAAQGNLGTEIFAQTGESSYKPRNFEAVPFIDKQLFDKHIRQASSVISHAGMGTVAAVLEYGKPMLVMPRQRKYGEVVNDHQLAIANRFEISGYLLAAYEAEDLAAKIEQLKTFVPSRRESQPQRVAGRIARFLTEINKK
jgi:UDP-N-acetylglucosamine transferase subunit ALG13